MKLLTIHHPIRPAEDDFCFGVEGELAIAVGTNCQNPNCGCDRAVIGLNSCRASTTVRVADLTLTEQEVLTAILGYLDHSGWAELIDDVGEYAREIFDFAAKVAADHAEGDVLRPHFDAEQDTWTFTPAHEAR